MEVGNDLNLVFHQAHFWEYALLGRYIYQKWEKGRWELFDAC